MATLRMILKPLLKELKILSLIWFFAAIGFPRQEELISLLRQAEVPAIMMGVGGSFDVFSGAVKRARKYFKKLILNGFIA